MEVRILGPLEVSVEDRPVDVPAGKAGLLLAALVVDANHLVSVDRLLEFLWRGHPPATAANTLQTYISHLRRRLEPDRAPREPGRILIRRPPGYILAVGPDQVDAIRFERLIEQARRMLDDNPDAAAAQLRTALALWRGEPLADFTFEPFAQSEITRLTELRLAATEDRIDADLALGCHAPLCAEVAQLVRDNPLRERLSGQLMVALYRCGRQADALRAYAGLRSTLREQLGIDPSPTLARLEQAILRQLPDLDYPHRTDRLARRPLSLVDAAVATAPLDSSLSDTLTAARSAMGQLRWREAFDLFCVADQAGGLTGEDLDALAEAAFWLGRPHQAHLARQRAHSAFLAEGRPRMAAMVAIVLSVNYGARRRFSVSEGWFQRAQRLLTDEPEGPEHGYLAWAHAMFSLGAGEFDEALEAAGRAFEVGRRFDVPDLQALGLVHQGYVRVRQCQVAEGLRLVDEAMTWAVEGRLAPTSSAVVFCRTIDTCYALGDYRRAAEWMEAIAECFTRTGIRAFSGDCEAHSVAMLVGRGAWSEGELRARRAAADMEPMDLTHVGLALAEIGQIRLGRGDIDGADKALTRAVELGVTCHPGPALVRLARGDVHAAAVSIAVALADQTRDSLARGRLLPVQVEIALANHDIATARTAAAELAEIANRYARPGLAAAAACAHGAVTLADGDATKAIGPLRRGVMLWHEAGAPYPAARARLLLSEALDRQGDHQNALIELEAARTTFDALGARPDLERTARLTAHIRHVGDAVGGQRLRAQCAPWDSNP